MDKRPIFYRDIIPGTTDLSVCLQLLSNDTAREIHLGYEAVLIIKGADVSRKLSLFIIVNRIHPVVWKSLTPNLHIKNAEYTS